MDGLRLSDGDDRHRVIFVQCDDICLRYGFSAFVERREQPVRPLALLFLTRQIGGKEHPNYGRPRS